MIKSYRPNLSTHLRNVNVRNLIAKKSGSSSVIFISEENNEIILKVFDSSENFNFMERYSTKENQEKLLTKIKGSLETYKKIIPYHGTVLNSGNGFITMTGGKEFNVLPGGHVEIFKKEEKITYKQFVCSCAATGCKGQWSHISPNVCIFDIA